MIAFLSALLLTTCQLGRTIRASDPKILQIGRFKYVDGDLVCSWSASTVAVRVRAKELSMELSSQGDNYVQVEVDGKPEQVIHLPGSQERLKMTWATKSEHEIRLIKRTESFVGTVTIGDFSVGYDDEFLTAKPKKHLIEAIGDSITCGFGDEGKAKEEPFATATENAYQAYGSVAARLLDSDVQTYCWSGRKMWPDNTVPEIYDLIIPTETSHIVDWASVRQPDVVLINLATNDFGKENPERAGWIKAYEEFLIRVRKHYPKAMIYCALGSMMSDNWPPEHKALSTLRDYVKQIVKDRVAAGDSKVSSIEFDAQDENDGYGAAWHPNLVTHAKMAKKLVDTIKADLKW